MNEPYTFVDFGEEDYLDGIMCQYMIKGHNEGVIAYMFNETLARQVVDYLNEKRGFEKEVVKI